MLDLSFIKLCWSEITLICFLTDPYHKEKNPQDNTFILHFKIIFYFMNPAEAAPVHHHLNAFFYLIKFITTESKLLKLFRQEI